MGDGCLQAAGQSGISDTPVICLHTNTSTIEPRASRQSHSDEYEGNRSVVLAKGAITSPALYFRPPTFMSALNSAGDATPCVTARLPDGGVTTYDTLNTAVFRPAISRFPLVDRPVEVHRGGSTPALEAHVIFPLSPTHAQPGIIPDILTPNSAR